jgi:glycosyltransferase involved in cell wall biosynthesis
MKLPIISVILPTYNRKEMLANTLDSLLQQETGELFCFEIVVVDDRSDDGTNIFVREMEKKYPDQVRYITGKGMGYTCALNSGLEASRGDWIAFFDDDQLACAVWLRELLSAALKQSAVLVGGPIALGISAEQHSRLGPVYLDMCGESHDISYPQKYSNTNPLPSGGNRLVKRSVFAEIGCFDEQMLTGGCDRDFLLRALGAGCPMGWAPEAKVRHMISVERLTPERIKWYSLQWGCSFAYIDWKRWGRGKTLLSAVARTGQSLLVHLPLFLWYLLSRNRKLFLDRRSLLYRAQGYIRKTLSLLAPNIFIQKYFFSKVEFRKQRDVKA